MRTDVEIIESVRSAYADAHFAPSYEQILTRAGGRRRRWGFVLPFSAGVAVAATAAALVLVVQVMLRPTPAEREAAFNAMFAEQCASLWSTLVPAQDVGHLDEVVRTAPPPTKHTFSFHDGDLGLRVYATDHVTYWCERGADGQVHGRIDPFFPPMTDEPYSIAAELNLTGEPESYVGAFTGDADRVLARLADGRTVPGVVSDGMFVIWAARERLAGATVELYRGDRLLRSALPNYLSGSFDTKVFVDVCWHAMAETLRTAPNVPDAVRNAPPVRQFWLAQGDVWVVFYGDATYMAACERTEPSGHVGVDYTYQPTPAGWRPLQFMASLDPPGYVFGVAPAGTESVEVHLSDGQTIPAELGAGFFLASWPDTHTDIDVAKIVAVTPDTVYVGKPGDVLETHPR